MGTSTFTGPIKAGDVLDTTGTAAGSVKNVGFVMMAQTVSITQAGTAAAGATTICIPANSHIVNIQVLATVAWSGAASTISLGTSVTSTELVSALMQLVRLSGPMSVRPMLSFMLCLQTLVRVSAILSSVTSKLKTLN